MQHRDKLNTTAKYVEQYTAEQKLNSIQWWTIVNSKEAWGELEGDKSGILSSNILQSLAEKKIQLNEGILHSLQIIQSKAKDNPALHKDNTASRAINKLCIYPHSELQYMKSFWKTSVRQTR